MKQVRVKARPRKREQDEPDRAYGDPAIAAAKAARRRQERTS